MHAVRSFAFLCALVTGLMVVVLINAEATPSAMSGGIILFVPSLAFWLWMRHVTCRSCKGRRGFSVPVRRGVYDHRTCGSCHGSGRPPRYQY